MPSSTLRRGSFDGGPRLMALWAGVLAGPVVWATLLETNYTLSYVACEQRHTWMLYVSTIVALLIIGAAALASWNARPSLREDKGVFKQDEEPSIEPEETGLLRARFMLVGGLTLCAFFSLVIIATAIPAIVLHPCNW
jgi:hypothetical protein